ncbi:NADH dehydrogenase [ubiquinone] 1 alpha subcomplex assembly factor 1 [Catalinimonas alkaloidigena]|uniref:CIA30 family protein n=1 Tax=Catalinimonas alkaloidigena TaxID=1075417 RepID=UPI0024049BEC|nr:CIA30 family protein [Catalinimonas alkaloidigena]MDF9794849.1 NADH dehydrogenase [ubiquinone] 1 alpha subcomplex assembly factor 1 [Catalinimonas alkaloidigena]
MDNDFFFLSNPQYQADWKCINDTIMGGISKSTAYQNHNNHLEWSGELSLKNNGGFASVRYEILPTINLQAYQGLSIVIIGDNKSYKLNLANQLTPKSPRFQARFHSCTTEQIVHIPFLELEASIRGRKVEESFDPSRISMVGFLISEQQEGPFHLTVKSIKPYVQ